MQEHFDRAVVIGRFQPLHNGHLTAINKALEIADTVIVLVGSTRTPRTIKNPFTFEERAQMIRSVYNDRVTVAGLSDFKYDDTKWITQVRKRVAEVAPPRIGGITHGDLHGQRTAIVGLDKDASSYYLRILAPWTFVEHAVETQLAATDIRDLYLRSQLPGFYEAVVPAGVRRIMFGFSTTFAFKELADEARFVREYRKKYDGLQYPPTHYTADAIVVQSGHILLVERGKAPGKGLFALPGGFVQQDEVASQAAMRELYEETGVKVQAKIMADKFVTSRIFDAPDRDPRGRVVTVAHLFKLDDSEKLPRVKAGDDAAGAHWVQLDKFEGMEPLMYSDHWHIARVMLGSLP